MWRKGERSGKCWKCDVTRRHGDRARLVALSPCHSVTCHRLLAITIERAHTRRRSAGATGRGGPLQLQGDHNRGKLNRLLRAALAVRATSAIGRGAAAVDLEAVVLVVGDPVDAIER